MKCFLCREELDSVYYAFYKKYIGNYNKTVVCNICHLRFYGTDRGN